MPRPLFTPVKVPVRIVQEAGYAPGPVWTGAENPRFPPGFEPRTVQPAASRCTDYATQLICVDAEAQKFLMEKSSYVFGI
jgi:hypothetical protein